MRWDAQTKVTTLACKSFQFPIQKWKFIFLENNQSYISQYQTQFQQKIYARKYQKPDKNKMKLGFVVTKTSVKFTNVGKKRTLKIWLVD